MFGKGQDNILKLRSALGYSGLDPFAASKEGICRGVAQTAINAFVLEKVLQKEAIEKKSADERQNEFDRYLQRISFILKFYDVLPQLITNTKRDIIQKIDREKTDAKSRQLNKEEQLFFDVAALIENMQIFAYPDKYSELFGKPLTQKDILELSYYAQPLELEKRSIPIKTTSNETDQTNKLLSETKTKSGIVLTDAITGIYNRDELGRYMAIISSLVESHPCDLALGIDNDEHAISLFYDAAKKIWTMIDAENLSEKSVTSGELATRISTGLPFTFDPRKAFTMKFFTSVNRKNEMQDFIKEVKSDKEFIALHEITIERAKMSDLKGISLAYLAASENNVSLVSDLSKLKDTNDNPIVDFNQPIGDGTTPLFMAIQNGCADVVKLLAELRSSNDKRIIDFTKITKYKKVTWNPLFLAAQKNQADVIKVLANLKNLDGTLVIDFNQLINDESAVFTAAQYGVDALKVLVDLKTSTGARIVDVNRPIPGGITPLYIAVTSRRADTFKVLCELRNPDGTYVIDINKPVLYGKKAIHLAAREGSLDIIKYLADSRQSSIDFNEPDTGGLTPSHIASANNQVAVLKLLDKIGADVEKNIADKSPIDLAKHHSVFNFYNALKKRKELFDKLEFLKHNKINVPDFEKIKASIMEKFYIDHEYFLKPNEFTDKITSLKKPEIGLQIPLGIFAAKENQSSVQKEVVTNTPFEYQMELSTEDDAIVLTFQTSLVLKLIQKSTDPIIWELSAGHDFDKGASVAIHNEELIEKLVTGFKQKNLLACLELIKNKPGGHFRTIAKRIDNEMKTQLSEYEQNIADRKKL